MILSYTLNSQTEDLKRIFGNVTIDSDADISSSGNLSFSIISFHIHCDGLAFCGCGNHSDTIRFHAGPPGSDTIVTADAFWSMGDWNNGGSGVWFRNADWTRYESADSTFGKLDFYRYLGPRIELHADMVTEGPFQPIGKVWLTWNPQFYLYDEHTLAPPEKFELPAKK